MTKKKGMKKVIKKVKEHVAIVFDCPFCSHSETVQCKMYKLNNYFIRNRKEKNGELVCRVCNQRYQAPITSI